MKINDCLKNFDDRRKECRRSLLFEIPECETTTKQAAFQVVRRSRNKSRSALGTEARH